MKARNENAVMNMHPVEIQSKDFNLRKERKGNREGVCPICENSENIEMSLDNISQDDDFVYKFGKCLNCGAKLEELHLKVTRFSYIIGKRKIKKGKK